MSGAPAASTEERALPAPAPRASQTTRFHRRVLAEQLALRPAGGVDRIAAVLSDARVDLNPHQVEAAAFALDCLPRGGCVLADEVGLGKTIEAGLVIAQLAAEGKERVLVLCPATLRLQWRAELWDKFGIAAQLVDGRGPPGGFASCAGAAIASIPFGALRADELLRTPWDLVVIDEAHRLRNAYKPGHKTGRALHRALRDRPKLLLTATPLQNDLLELLGLMSFLDERILGPEAAFRVRYGEPGRLSEDGARELKGRLAPAVTRTLRRQVKEYVRFTERRGIVEDFVPTEEEEALYEKVSEYLRRSKALAVDPERKPLLLLVYRKLLASSSFAIAPTLRKLADSLEARSPLELEELAEYEEEAEAWDVGGRRSRILDEAAREVAELRGYATLAEQIRANAKGDALVRALDRLFTVARAHQWPEKAVVFTESRRTQEYLYRLLEERGHAGAVARLSGDAATPEQRQAIVEDFRRRARVLLSTEAGAEGLNLQFCNVVVNYDLPWNPQRLEQRIGRCHRYGQTRDVLVINFLNRRNAADARLHELLDQKLQLFDGVFGASDEILGALESGLDFERRVLDIYQSCRTPEEVDAAFDALRADISGRIDSKVGEARALLFERFDADVRKRLRMTGERVRGALAERARATEAVGPVPRDLRALPPESLCYLQLQPAALPGSRRDLAGTEGWWFVYRFELAGARLEERLVHVVLVKQGERFLALSSEAAASLLELPAHEELRRRPESVIISSAQERALAQARTSLLHQVDAQVQEELDHARERLDQYSQDCLEEPRRKAERSRIAWEEARRALVQAGPEERAKARASLLRAEREHRKSAGALRSEEDARVAERDRNLVQLVDQWKVRDNRVLVASAYWWL